MLTTLIINNLLFVEKAEIHFGPGLNILTGETGAGKSAILSAICLLGGQRSDLQLIGKHRDFASIEAVIIGALLPEEIEPSPTYIIRRELHKSGKSRCFINDQQISLTTLRQVTEPLVEVIDQASSHFLCTQEVQRESIDLFGNLTKKAEKLTEDVLRKEALEKELTSLQGQDPRLLTWMQEDLTLIEEVNWKEGEEESLTEEHHRLTHGQEFEEKISKALEIIDSAQLKKAIPLLEGPFQEIAQLLKTAICEIDEVSHALHKKAHQFETNPKRLEIIEKRMRLLDQIKRRFGKTCTEVESKKKELQEKIALLTERDERIAKYTQEIEEQNLKNLATATVLSQERKSSATSLQKKLLTHLQTLNLPHAQLEIAFAKTELTTHGIDSIEFLFSANPDRAPMPLKDCASGGELSRVFLSLKTVLAEKDTKTCLVFDEIDGNVGGQTAVVLAEKLKTIARTKQVICVTHFVQVARLATKHFVVSKKQEGQNTLTQVHLLDDASCEQEYNRMLGASIVV